MRISDLSSDVCSSDLVSDPSTYCSIQERHPGSDSTGCRKALFDRHHLRRIRGLQGKYVLKASAQPSLMIIAMQHDWHSLGMQGFNQRIGICRQESEGRSEEHTSELQSLMRS